MAEQDKIIRQNGQLMAEIDAMRSRMAELEIGESECCRIAEELRAEIDKSRKYLEVAEVMIMVVNADQKVTLINKKGCQILGRRKRDVLGRNWFDTFIPERIREEVRAVFTRIMAGDLGPVEYFENPVLSKSGQERIISWHNTVLRNAQGKITAVLGSGEDITERRQAEEELRQYRFQLEELVKRRTADLKTANDLLRQEVGERRRAEDAAKRAYAELNQIFNTAADGLCVIDKEYVIIRVNDTFSKILGLPKDEIIGRKCHEVFHESFCEGLYCPLSFVLRGEPAAEAYIELCHRDGSKIPCLVTFTPFRSPDGELIGIIENFKDITERKKAEEELQRVQKLESLGVLAGGIAHDFNNILTTILGSLSLARLYIKSGGNVLDALMGAEKASLEAKNLTRQLLTFAKGGEPIKETVSIVKFLRQSACLSLSGSKTKCSLSVPDDLWWAEIDEDQINQALSNIIINADQAMPEGGLVEVKAENAVVRAGSGSSLKEGKYIKISIRDQGTGIPEEYLDKIFDPYFTTKQDGSGLGLSIAYSIVKKHGGYLTVESEVGAGTTFTLYLPALERETLAVGGFEEERLRPGQGKILLMDDQPSVREVIGTMLSYIGYEVEFAMDGDEAVEKYRQARESGQPFDAVILDLIVPGGMGGEEAARQLRAIDPEVKMIVSSGYSNDPVMSGYRDYGFEGVIAKPYEIQELSGVLHKILVLH